MTPRLAALIGLAALLIGPACSGGGEEGAPCNRAKGNDDCAAGLVCTSNIDIAASTPRCCPASPHQPSTSACAPAGADFTPDAAVKPIGVGGGGGTAGSGGSAGSGGTAGSDSGSAGAGGTAGSDAGSAGTGGTAGSDAGGAGAGGADAGGD